MLQLDELTALLGELNASRGHGDGFTMAEVAEASGCCVPVARVRIGNLIRAGKVELAGTRPMVRIDGRPCLTPIYRFTNAPKPIQAKARRKA